MDLQKITIENFKCFKSKTEIELGEITLLTGANSSGKSSIIYSILGAIQSGEFPFQFSTNGKYVNMGDFNEIVFNHNKNNEIKLGFTFTNDNIYTIETTWKADTENNLPKLSELKATSNYFGLSIKENDNKKYIVDFKYEPQKTLDGNPFLELIKSIADVFITNEKYKLNEIINEEDIAAVVYLVKEPQYLKNIEINDFSLKSNIKNFNLYLAFEDLKKQFKHYDNNLNFIGSFRRHPERVYLETSKTNLKVENDGNTYLDQIIAWKTKNPEKIKELVDVLKELNLLNDIEAKRNGGGQYDILIKTKEDGIFSSLCDVGFGISQFLPIIVADLQMPEASTLLVAQPEIHLHPSVQSAFGDYLIKQTKNNSKKYIIETHSEYLLNKIRLGIVKGEIDEENVKIYFLDNQGEEAVLHKIRFNKQGQILNAPENFFKTYMIDVMEIAINAAN